VTPARRLFFLEQSAGCSTVTRKARRPILVEPVKFRPESLALYRAQETNRLEPMFAWLDRLKSSHATARCEPPTWAGWPSKAPQAPQACGPGLNSRGIQLNRSMPPARTPGRHTVQVEIHPAPVAAGSPPPCCVGGHQPSTSGCPRLLLRCRKHHPVSGGLCHPNRARQQPPAPHSGCSRSRHSSCTAGVGGGLRRRCRVHHPAPRAGRRQAASTTAPGPLLGPSGRYH